MIAEFRKFIMRGNVLDLAVGIIIGAAFTSIVNSLVNDIIMPPIGYVLGGVDFSNIFINLSGGEYASLAEAQAAGAATINIGLFINAVINFLIVAFVVFLIVRSFNQMMERVQRKQATPEDPATKACPYCLSVIPVKATRCPNCTSQLEGAPAT
jgi:large conductance mechanosensitive channel